VTIDPGLLRAADILPYEEVDIWNCTNGARLSTYVIEGEPGSGEICVNGAAAHLVKPGNVVIIASWAHVDDQAARGWEGIRVFVDERNRIRD
jgi:aspartate 1-decarboxylase